ncbi:MAG: helix-turn-helix transcriptional regulator [Candidatus Sedimenticola sp. (ex Thyasira tokunagai)]
MLNKNMFFTITYMTTSKAPKKQLKRDWHPADIICELKKARWTLSKLSKHHEYGRTSLQKALRRPWPKAERFIAEAIGVAPEEIWPSRYLDNTTVNARYQRSKSEAKRKGKQVVSTTKGRAA